MVGEIIEHTLVTGGAGRLGRTLKQLRPEITTYTHGELDVTNRRRIFEVFGRDKPECVIHLAALTDLVRCEKSREDAWRVNVVGTKNVADASIKYGAYLVYTSTDYVFDGDGPFKEDDPLNPPNYYALTKAIGEFIVRRAPKHLITRCTMKERGKWHPKAPVDMLESMSYYDEFAEILLKLIELRVQGVVHVATQGDWTVYEFAKLQRPDVKPCYRKDIWLKLPRDCRLNTDRLKEILR